MWYDANSGIETHEVGTRSPNPWGLYDVHGNVWEWCEDWHSGTYYQYCVDNSITDDPQGPASDTYRVVRGSAYGNPAYNCRSASRYRSTPDCRDSGFGFRAVLAP